MYVSLPLFFFKASCSYSTSIVCGIKLRVEYEAGACEDARVNARIRELVELNVLKRTA